MLSDEQRAVLTQGELDQYDSGIWWVEVYERLADARLEAKRYREVLEQVHKMVGHNHWDETMQRGAGCRMCIQQREIMEQVRAALESNL